MTDDKSAARQTRRKVVRTIGGSAFALGSLSVTGLAAANSRQPLVKVKRASFDPLEWVRMEYHAPEDAPTANITIHRPSGYSTQAELDPGVSGVWEFNREGTYQFEVDPAGILIKPDTIRR